MHLKAFPARVLAIFDGGAELPVLSYRVYQQMDPQPELRPTSETLRGLYGPAHQPLGECTVTLEMPELGVRVTYNVIVDDISEDILIDAYLMGYLDISLKYADRELTRKGKTVKGIARVKGEGCVWRLMLAQDCLVEPQSRQLVPGP